MGYLELGGGGRARPVRSSLQSISAASARSSTWGPRVRETLTQTQSTTARMRARTPVISRRVHAEPGRERDRAVHLAAALAHRGDRRAAADHRHDALVLVAERLRRRARRSRRAGSSRPTPRSGGPRSRAAGAARRPGPGCSRRRRPHRRGGSPSPSARAARRCGRRAPAARRPRRPAAGAVMPPPHTTHRVGISVPSPSVTCPGATSVTLVSRCSSTPLRRRTFVDVVVRALRERPQQRVAEVDDVHPRRRDREVAVLDGHRPVDHVGERAGRLDAGRRRRRRRRS